MKIFKLLNNPYPFDDDLKHNTKLIFFISLGIAAFLYLLQPLDIGLLSTNKKLYFIVGIAVITFLTMSLNLLLVPSLFPEKFSSAVWTIKKEIIWDLIILSISLIGYFFYGHFLGIMQISFSLVVKLLLTAIFPISALIIVNQNRMLRSNLVMANELNKKLKENKLSGEKIVQFVSDYQKDSLAIKVSLIVLIRSANNYIEVSWREMQEVKTQMVRCSLIYAENLLKDDKFIFKCHRSYLVNINYIDKVEGNSQGYKLYLENVPVPVPVSKVFAQKLKELL
jgi:predicted house-cleaning noncanonical NTP pyrophosphatase (MazG superfamily)